MAERQVDLPQLFSDVSRTISGISNIMGTGSQADSPDGSPDSGGPSMMSGLFGNTCFKACGMEDIQFAARSAGDMLISLRVCIIILTIVLVLSITILTGAVIYLTCRKAPPRRLPLPAFVRDVFPKQPNNNNKEDVET